MMFLFVFRDDDTGVEKEIFATTRERAEDHARSLMPKALFFLVWTDHPNYEDSQLFWEGLLSDTAAVSPSCSPGRFVESFSERY